MAGVGMMFIGVGYAVSSSALVVVNKWAMSNWAYASALTVLQFTVAWMVALVAGTLGICEVDRLEWKKVKAFAPACLLFYLSIACNMKLLGHANVDTFIVLRSLVPLLTAFAERLYLGTPLPPAKALMALGVIVIGAAGYVSTDEGVSLTAYSWGAAYVGTMVVDTIIIKKIVTEVELKPWGLVYYNNLIASAMYPVFALFTGELVLIPVAISRLGESDILAPVLVSCVFGVSISYFGMNARKKLQATAFSVLGVMCKFMTVIVNTLVWEKHAPPLGLFFLCVCIAGGIAYQQILKGAVMTKTPDAKGEFQPLPTDDEDIEMNGAIQPKLAQKV